MKTYHDLPAPTAAASARSHALQEIIKLKIQQSNGCLPFADFMQLALYHPEYGYYQRQDFALGKGGDFTTAPEISPLFAYCFARQCREIFESTGTAVILELGAGSGRFALDLLTRLETLQALPERYYILEISASLRLKQRALLQTERPDLLERIEWLDHLPEKISGVVIANEVLDAMPFHCFQIQNQHALERKVTIKNQEFNWTLATATPQLEQTIETLRATYYLPEGYQSEINLQATALVRQLCEALTSGVILFADYGYGQREYYHPERVHGSLTCFYQHLSHNQPLIYPGLQDITAHVDFTRVIETAAEYGGELAGFTTQCAFLLANDLLAEAEVMEAGATEADAFRLHQSIKLLTMPMEMGDRIKIMAISKTLTTPLTGFSTLSRSRDL